MEFGKQRKAFRIWKISHVGTIKTSANSLYHELLDFAFDLGKPKFDLTNDSLRMMAGYSNSKSDETKLANDRNRLVELGLIKYTKGVRNRTSPVYEIVKLYGENSGNPVGNVMGKTVDETVVKPRVETVATTVGKTVANNTKTDSLDKIRQDKNNNVNDVGNFVYTSTSQELSSYWQEIIMTTINSDNIKDLTQDAQDFGEQGVALVKRAIKLTANAGKNNFSYYTAIVRNWLRQGVKTLGDVDKLDQQHRQSRQYSQGSKSYGNGRKIIEPELASVSEPIEESERELPEWLTDVAKYL